MSQPPFAYCKIFPGISIARLGNSPEGYFIGPECPGVVPDNGGSYKDDLGRVKRQAARFRVYAFDEHDQVAAELTADHPAIAAITWTVTLANRKAEWHRFAGASNVAKVLAQAPDAPSLRNADLTGDARKALVIGPASASVAGRRQHAGPLVGRFLTKTTDIVLGDLRTDDAGRLLVLGGRGESDTVLPDNPLNHYANNDRWHDDTSDGPVAVAVTLNSGEQVPVRGRAWVIVPPPHFSPTPRTSCRSTTSWLKPPSN